MSPRETYPKRLIEVDLPIRRISEHARNEKDSRCGHIPRLHIYPAARPLGACRAVICSALWPDPADPNCAVAFVETVRSEMLAWTSHERQRLLGLQSQERFERARQDPSLFDNVDELRGALFDFIADFANWDNATVCEYLDTSRNITHVAHQTMRDSSGGKPLILDPFAGGGAIPLEALRVGAEAFSSDLNPLSVLINRVILQHIPEFGEALLKEIDTFAAWLKARVTAELCEFFPSDADGATPIAYLWARTILSEAPSTGQYPIEVPLIRSMWLTRARRAGNWAMRWVTDKAGRPRSELVEITFADGNSRKVRRLLLEVFQPTKADPVPSGTIRGGSVVCPVTGFTTPVKRVRAQLSERHGGTRDARMYCVVTSSVKAGTRGFRIATAHDHADAYRAKEALKSRFSQDELLTEELPPEGTNGFRVRKYGMHTWGDLFTARQTLALLTYAKLVRIYIGQLATANQRMKAALESIFALLVNRLADLNASLCGWQLNTPNTAHVFVRWALPMMFDFGEVNPLAAAGGSPESALRRIKACVNDLVAGQFERKATVSQHSAASLPLADHIADALITDPPYYDAIPYSDLLDFFVIWMRRVCRHQEFILVGGVSPKEEECVVDKGQCKDHEFFRRTMTLCMAEARRVLTPAGIGVVIFAHKSTAGWEAQLESLISAGFSVTASWPIDTEMVSRMRAQGSAALASSVHLVCRPREAGGDSAHTDEVGDWRDVLQELPRRIHEWMPRLTEEGVVGADAIFACLGPALGIFSRYAYVEKVSGETVPLKEYLEHVWAAIAREALSTVLQDSDSGSLEPDARLTVIWLWTLGGGDTATADHADPETEEVDRDDEDGPKTMAGYVLEFDAARKIAQGLGADLKALTHVVTVKGDTARLLAVADRAQHLFGKTEGLATAKRQATNKQIALFSEIEEVAAEQSWGDVGTPKSGTTTLDRVHQAMLLFASGRGEALKRFLVEEGIGQQAAFWKLSQALSALYPTRSDERRWIEGVLARKKSLGF